VSAGCSVAEDLRREAGGTKDAAAGRRAVWRGGVDTGIQEFVGTREQGGAGLARSSTTFHRGQSGNPHGRPSVAKSIQELARQHTGDAVKALVAALKNPRERVAAANVLLGYGYGRPVQTQNVRTIRSFADLTDEEIAALVSEGEADASGIRH
jgi:hypothetical protein